MKWIYNDGGREQAGFKNKAGDCLCRATAIITGKPYLSVYNLINFLGKAEHTGKRKKGISNARLGVYKTTEKKLLECLGFTFIPTMFIGQGCKIHLKADEIPQGKFICHVSKHYVAVIDGVINDTFDPSREGTRCVYGYWKQEK